MDCKINCRLARDIKVPHFAQRWMQPPWRSAVQTAETLLLEYQTTQRKGPLDRPPPRGDRDPVEQFYFVISFVRLIGAFYVVMVNKLCRSPVF